MKRICLLLIEFYQRVISPRKGFRCAHHVLHGKQTCSNAVKDLIVEHGILAAWPKIRKRFKACRTAYQTLIANPTLLPRTDIPCDLPCDVSFADCSFGDGGSKGTGCSPCDLMHCDGPRLSRRTWRRIIIASFIVSLLASYWFYGRGVSSITLIDLGKRQNMVEQLIQREQPQLRVLLIVNGKKYYSEITQLESKNRPTTLFFREAAPLAYKIDTLQVLDARVNLGGNLFVIGQVLDEFSKPSKQGVGQRFQYKIKRRWHLF